MLFFFRFYNMHGGRQTASSKSAEGIEIGNVAGVFCILAVGAVISLITCVIEFVWFSYLSNDQDRAPDPFNPKLPIPPPPNPSYDSLRHHMVKNFKDKGGHVILNKHLSPSIRHKFIIHNGGLIHRISREPSARESVKFCSNFIPKKVIITLSIADITPCSSRKLNLGQDVNSSPPESHPPYLNYLPLKTVSSARLKERTVNVQKIC